MNPKHARPWRCTHQCLLGIKVVPDPRSRPAMAATPTSGNCSTASAVRCSTRRPSWMKVAEPKPAHGHDWHGDRGYRTRARTASHDRGGLIVLAWLAVGVVIARLIGAAAAR